VPPSTGMTSIELMFIAIKLMSIAKDVKGDVARLTHGIRTAS
jgi:hypothetical protein